MSAGGTVAASLAITPGAYLRRRREAAGLSIEDVALMTETVPPVGARRRAEWIAAMEAGIEAITADVALRLAAASADGAYPFDPRILADLVAIAAGEPRDPPRLCRSCACSWLDACVGADGQTCAWAEPDLCTACLVDAVGQGFSRRVPLAGLNGAAELAGLR